MTYTQFHRIRPGSTRLHPASRSPAEVYPASIQIDWASSQFTQLPARFTSIRLDLTCDLSAEHDPLRPASLSSTKLHQASSGSLCLRAARQGSTELAPALRGFTEFRQATQSSTQLHAILDRALTESFAAKLNWALPDSYSIRLYRAHTGFTELPQVPPDSTPTGAPAPVQATAPIVRVHPVSPGTPMLHRRTRPFTARHVALCGWLFLELPWRHFLTLTDGTTEITDAHRIDP